MKKILEKNFLQKHARCNSKIFFSDGEVFATCVLFRASTSISLWEKGTAHRFYERFFFRASTYSSASTSIKSEKLARNASYPPRRDRLVKGSIHHYYTRRKVESRKFLETCIRLQYLYIYERGKTSRRGRTHFSDHSCRVHGPRCGSSKFSVGVAINH